MTQTEIDRLRRAWYKRAGITDIEPGDTLIYEWGARSHDGQDIEFSGEMADAARAVIDDPGLKPRERAVWRRYCAGAGYDQIAADLGCSFRFVAASIRLARALMLRPTERTDTMAQEVKRGRGRPPTMHARGNGGLTACGKAVEKDRLTSPGASNCAPCRHVLGLDKAAKSVRKVATVKPVRALVQNAPKRKPGRPRKVAAAPMTPEAVEAAATFGELTIPPETPPAQLEGFTSIEDTIAIGAKIAHRLIAETASKPELAPMDSVTNERAVRTLLAIRESERRYLPLAPSSPAPAETVQGRIAAETSA